jgi:hypothetical protein
MLPTGCVADDRVGEPALGHDVGDGGPAAGLEYPCDLTEDRGLVLAQVDDAVADDDRCPAVGNRRLLDIARFQAHGAVAVAGGEAPGLVELLLGHVDADDLAVGPGLVCREEQVHARAGLVPAMMM